MIITFFIFIYILSIGDLLTMLLYIPVIIILAMVYFEFDMNIMIYIFIFTLMIILIFVLYPSKKVEYKTYLCEGMKNICKLETGEFGISNHKRYGKGCHDIKNLKHDFKGRNTSNNNNKMSVKLKPKMAKNIWTHALTQGDLETYQERYLGPHYKLVETVPYDANKSHNHRYIKANFINIGSNETDIIDFSKNYTNCLDITKTDLKSACTSLMKNPDYIPESIVVGADSRCFDPITGKLSDNYGRAKCGINGLKTDELPIGLSNEYYDGECKKKYKNSHLNKLDYTNTTPGKLRAVCDL